MNDEILFAREDDTAAVPVDDGVDSQKYLIFMAAHLKLGVVAEDVVEILNNPWCPAIFGALSICAAR